MIPQHKELRRQLYALFSAYGKVIDVIATRAQGMKGQAFVVFRDLASATAARRALEGFEFYERGLHISYAKSQSKATILLQRGPEALFDPGIMSSIGDKQKFTYSSAQAEQRGRERKRQHEEARQRGERVQDDGDDSDVGKQEQEQAQETQSEADEGSDGEPKSKIRKIETDKPAPAGPAAANGVSTRGDSAFKGQHQPVEGEDEDEDEQEMDMSDSESDDGVTSGPIAP